MISKRYIVCLLLCLCALSSYAQEERWGMNNPYIDDKLFHMGFQIGFPFNSYLVHCSEDSITMYKEISGSVNSVRDTLHARVGFAVPGIRIGFVTDLRLCKYLNLRFTPGIEFSSTTISYKSVSGDPVRNQTGDNRGDISVMALPIDLPLYLKFSAEREANFRPYVIAGGGVRFNVLRMKEKPILLKVTDYFCQVGFGCDIYFPWFKLCPELTYRFGFANQLVPLSERDDIENQNRFYTKSISTMTNQAICLTFNFE